MKEIFLIKHGEIVLKGQNRASFSKLLSDNAAKLLRPYGKFKLYTLQSTLYAEPVSSDIDMETAFNSLKKLFGAAALSRAYQCEKSLPEIIETADEHFGPRLKNAASFKVEARRSDKSFPYTSPQIQQEVGGSLHDLYPHLKVAVKNPEIGITVEVRDKHAYVHDFSLPGAGGLPVGSGGRAAALLSGGIDSPVAAYMLAKRGVELIFVHFFSYPYTSQRALDKVYTLMEILSSWGAGSKIFVVPFTKIQEAIRASCPEKYFTLVMRRFMMRISEKIAEANKCGALITGESLGQVASQTMQAMNVTGNVCKLPVLRPLIGLDKEEIVIVARKIGTFETSILPYEDCCTVFTPRHPKTKPVLGDMLIAESKLDIEGLTEEAAASATIKEI